MVFVHCLIIKIKYCPFGGVTRKLCMCAFSKNLSINPVLVCYVVYQLYGISRRRSLIQTTIIYLGKPTIKKNEKTKQNTKPNELHFESEKMLKK